MADSNGYAEKYSWYNIRAEKYLLNDISKAISKFYQPFLEFSIIESINDNSPLWSVVSKYLPLSEAFGKAYRPNYYRIYFDAENNAERMKHITSLKSDIKNFTNSETTNRFLTSIDYEPYMYPSLLLVLVGQAKPHLSLMSVLGTV